MPVRESQLTNPEFFSIQQRSDPTAIALTFAVIGRIVQRPCYISHRRQSPSQLSFPSWIAIATFRAQPCGKTACIELTR